MAISAVSLGYKVALLCKVSTHKELIEGHGIEVISWSLKRNSMNIISEIKAYKEVTSAIHYFQPDIVHSVALKPMLYNALQFHRKYTYSNVYALGGLGFIFSSKKHKASILRFILVSILRVALKRRNARIILQNSDDLNLLLKLKIIDRDKTCLIKGVGVDTELFKPFKNEPKVPTVMLPSRILWDKGISDFIQVARTIKLHLPETRFVLVGSPDKHNPESVPAVKLKQWVSEGIIECWGHSEEMHNIYKLATIVCFPSYREGLPKSLLEAASCAVPIVSYDVPGSREIVIDRLNGLLVPLKNTAELNNAIKILLSDHSLRESYGKSGRELVINEFSQEKIAVETSAVWKEVLNCRL
jgi:glycosyltransferase involved in cell wall biosynthesis